MLPSSSTTRDAGTPPATRPDDGSPTRDPSPDTGQATAPSFFGSTALHQSLSGLTAGASTTLLLHPLDFLKTRMQVSSGYTSSLRTARGILANEGFRAFYSGLTPSIIGTSLSWGLYFGWYSFYQRLIAPDAVPAYSSTTGQDQVFLTPLQTMGASALAGMTTSLMTNPIWVVKTRMCVQQHPSAGGPPAYSSVSSALLSIARNEGLRGLYRGFGMALLGSAHGAVQFGVYEPLKRHVSVFRFGAPGQRLSATDQLLCASVSKVVAVVSTYPIQLVKTHLQRERVKHLKISTLLREIFVANGVTGLYRGLGPALLRVLPQSSLTLLAYEQISVLLDTSQS
ncbi:hypothetical protein H696_04172 [Fonticula alba]|uniref:Uncharacterized protein n=1 Tax=Fonticula alba TaxID=691883 RepID=A0A058Z753_FONAL|nr:hypothetical protein H696_04172 [Fonticula alba]KCV69763.1 hypothetical protein H696_04172 [Fonticula alba]|eukprot:XP_009496328.1 hypothetical protein H696_04172 [Fonticula alba]